MKLSHEKVTQLSHKMMRAIERMDEIEIFEEPNVIRLEIVRILNDLLREEEKADQSARLQIASQKRTIPEGSGEWEILYRKYYAEALRKMGVVFSTPEQRR